MLGIDILCFHKTYPEGDNKKPQILVAQGLVPRVFDTQLAEMVLSRKDWIRDSRHKA